MNRLALVTVFAAACGGGSGFMTAPASVTGIVPSPRSASATSFNEVDAAGAMVMGWKISLWEDGDGADCMAAEPHRVAAISIYTNQPVTVGKKASLDSGQAINIVPDSPPTIAGTAAATMGAEKLGSITGIVTISDFHLKPDLSADDMKGTINAAGNDSNGAAVSITGTFDAPVCE